MLGDGPTVLADHDAVGISMNLDRASDGAGRQNLGMVGLLRCRRQD
jgi:hypothetical protein